MSLTIISASKVASTATGKTVAITSGVTRILLQGLSAVGVENFAMVNFGASATGAQAALNIAASVGTTGIAVREGDTTVGGSAVDVVVNVPDGSTHLAIADGVSGQHVTVNVVQGV